MTKLKNICLFAMSVVAIFTACVSSHSYTETDISKNETKLLASWVESYSSIEEMEVSSDLAITGTVVGSYTEMRYDLVFTRNQVRIEHIDKGDCTLYGVVDILQTGGTYGATTTPAIEDAPLLTVGETYELYLREVEPTEMYGEYYLILYATNGVSGYNDEVLGCALTAGTNTPAISDGWYWNKTSLSCYVPTSIKTLYGTTVYNGIMAGVKCWNNTDAPTVTAQSTSTIFDIDVMMNNYGAIGWDGICHPEYNTTTKVLTTASIDINAYYRQNYYDMQGLWQALACHEMGHALGLGHNDSGAASIMTSNTENYYDPDATSPRYTTPLTADINGINLIY